LNEELERKKFEVTASCHFSTWFVVFSVGLLAVMSPGPDFVLTIRNSLVYSRRAGIYTAIGIAVHVVHATYCLVGIGAIISLHFAV